MSKPPSGAPPNMPKKKDPRMRALQTNEGGTDSGRKFFDSVEYEVQRQKGQKQSTGKTDEMVTAARNQPHAGLPHNNQ